MILGGSHGTCDRDHIVGISPDPLGEPVSHHGVEYEKERVRFEFARERVGNGTAGWGAFGVERVVPCDQRGQIGQYVDREAQIRRGVLVGAAHQGRRVFGREGAHGGDEIGGGAFEQTATPRREQAVSYE